MAAPAVADASALERALTSLESLPMIVDDELGDPDAADAQADALEVFVVLLQAAAQHRMPTQLEVEQVELLWRRWYRPLSTVAAESPEVLEWAPADVGFMALCRSAYMQPSRAVDPADLALVHAQLSCVGSQHTCDSRDFWPPAHEWQAMRHAVANVVDGLLVTDAPTRHTLLEELRRLPPTVLEPALCKAHEARREPPEVADLLKGKRVAAEKARKAGDSDVRQEASEEAAGVLWRTSADEMVANFVRLASRVVWRVDLENWMAAQFAVESAPRFTPQTLQRADAWVRQRCSVELTEELCKTYRTILFESCAPLGAETQNARSKETREDAPTPLQVLEHELGINIAEWLYEYSRVKLADVARDHSLGWDALFLALFQYLCRNSHPEEVQCDWMQHYLVRRPAWREWVDRLRRADYQAHNKRPVVVHLQRRWRVLYKRPPPREEDAAYSEQQHPTVWLNCDSLLHAVLTWLHLVHERFGARTENEDRMQRACDTFLDEFSEQVG